MNQNLIPIHIAFIPLLVPPIIHVMNLLKMDRRLIASVLTFSLTAPYILLPYGFGFTFQEIIATQMEIAGLAIDMKDIPFAMIIPTAGLVVGLLIAIFISYRKPREYKREMTIEETAAVKINKKEIVFTVIALIAALVAQIQTESMIIGPTAGLNVDGQDNHIWDTCVPTFLHYHIPLLIFGWIAVMVL